MKILANFNSHTVFKNYNIAKISFHENVHFQSRSQEMRSHNIFWDFYLIVVSICKFCRKPQWDSIVTVSFVLFVCFVLFCFLFCFETAIPCFVLFFFSTFFFQLFLTTVHSCVWGGCVGVCVCVCVCVCEKVIFIWIGPCKKCANNKVHAICTVCLQPIGNFAPTIKQPWPFYLKPVFFPKNELFFYTKLRVGFFFSTTIFL